MIALIQHISRGSVSFKDQTNSIGRGFCILLGVGHDDGEEDVKKLAHKISNLRVFYDDDGKMNLSIDQIKGEILLISQFTLMANTKKGNRPSFINAAKPEIAKKLYLSLAEALRKYGIKVEIGFFGEMMDLDLKLDGPVTINLDTKNA